MKTTYPSLRAPIVCACGAWLCLTAVIAWAVASWHSREEIAAAEQGHAIVRTVENCVRPMGRRGALPEEYPADLLAEIARLPIVAGVALMKTNGMMVANTGIASNVLACVTGTNGTCFSQTELIAWSQVDLACLCGDGGCGMGQDMGRRAGRTEAAAGTVATPVILCVAIDSTALHARYRLDWIGAGVLSAALLLAAATFVLVWHLHQRALRYTAQLALAAEDNRMLQEMNITAAGLAHEVKNPLGVIRGTAQRLGKGGGAAGDCAIIVEEIDRVTSRLNEFLSFARPQPPRKQRTALGSVVESVRAVLGDELGEAGITIDAHGCAIDIMADPAQLRQVLFNLLHNVLRFAPQSGTVTIACTRKNGRAALRVTDGGPGMAQEHIARVFTPYFTTAVNGSGLGLAIVARIAHAHGWTVACDNVVPHGAWFEIGEIEPC